MKAPQKKKMETTVDSKIAKGGSINYRDVT